MLRSIFSAVVLAGLLAATQPALADPPAAPAPGHAQEAAAGPNEPSAPPIPPLAPAVGISKSTAPAGFGWS